MRSHPAGMAVDAYWSGDTYVLQSSHWHCANITRQGTSYEYVLGFVPLGGLVDPQTLANIGMKALSPPSKQRFRPPCEEMKETPDWLSGAKGV